MIEALRKRRLGLAWLLFTCVALAAIAFVWWLAFVNAPPRNAVLIESGPAGSAPVVGGAFSGDPRSPVADPPSPPPDPLPPETPAPTTLGVYVSGAVARPGVYDLPEGSRVGDAIDAAGGLAEGADADGINLAAYLRDEDHVVVGRIAETTIIAVILSPIPTAEVITPVRPVATTITRPAGTSTRAPRATASRTSVRTATPPRPTTTRAASPTRTPARPLTATQLPTSPPRPSPTRAPAATPGKLLVNINTATAAQLEELPGIGPVLAGRIVAYRDQYGLFKSIEDLTRISGIKEGILSKIRPYITVGR